MNVLRFMDQCWMEKGMDLRTSAYEIVATSSNTGFVEEVPDSRTISSLQMNSKPKKILEKAQASFSRSALYRWGLEESSVQFDTFFGNLILSCTAYTIITYVLGIGDRHNDNIMVSSEGKVSIKI